MDGFYSENTAGHCTDCDIITFINGYQFVEGRIDEKAGSKTLKEIVKNIRSGEYSSEDDHNLYRLSLVSLEFNKQTKQCNKPNIRLVRRILSLKDRPVAYTCIKPEKINSITTPYRAISKEKKRRYFILDVREHIREYTYNDEVIHYNNTLFFKAKTFFPINQIFYLREIECANNQRGRKLILSPKEILIPNKK